MLCHRGFVKNYLFHSSGYWQDSGYNNYVTALNFPQYCKILRGYKSFICCIPTNNDKHYTVLFLWNQFSSYISWACSMWYFANLANLFEKYLWFLKQYFNPENILNYILRHNTYQYDNYLWLTVLPKQWLSIWNSFSIAKSKLSMEWNVSVWIHSIFASKSDSALFIFLHGKFPPHWGILFWREI